MANWFWESSDQQPVGPRCERSAQSCNVTPLSWTSEGKAGTCYELCSNCPLSADPGWVREKECGTNSICATWWLKRASPSRSIRCFMLTLAPPTKQLRQWNYSHIISQNPSVSSYFKFSPRLSSDGWEHRCRQHWARAGHPPFMQERWYMYNRIDQVVCQVFLCCSSWLSWCQ